MPAPAEIILARLDRLADAMIAGSAVDPGDGVWFGLALREYLLGSEPTLERSLGLTKTGATRAALRKWSVRNPLIREACSRFYEGPSTVIAAAFAQDWSRYESGRWQTDRRSGVMPPSYADTSKEFQWRLLSAGFAALSRRQVWNVLSEMQSDPPPDCMEDASKLGHETTFQGQPENV